MPGGGEAYFSRPFPNINFRIHKIDFWMHFGRPLAHFWHPLASKWLPFGSRWLPFGSLSAPFGSLLHPFGSLWLTFGTLFAEFSRISWIYQYFLEISRISTHFQEFTWSAGILDFELSLFCGPVRVHCRRQLRSNQNWSKISQESFFFASNFSIIFCMPFFRLFLDFGPVWAPF